MLQTVPAASAIHLAVTDHGEFITLVAGKRPSVFFFSYACREPYFVSHKTASSSAECSRDKLPFSFVSGQYLTM